MPYLIYGEDTYRSRQKLNAIKQKYIDVSLGDTNLAVMSGASSKAEEIIRSLWAMPFLAPKRLVIIENLITLGNKDIQKEIIDFLPKIPKTTVAIFFEEGVPDKRSALFQKLNIPKFSEEFAPLDPTKLSRWANKQFVNLNTSIEPAALNILIEATGPDLWRLSNEISKLSIFSSNITISDVENLVHIEPKGDTFKLIDALANRNSQEALKMLKARLMQGDSPIYLLSMIIYGFRTLLIVQDGILRNPRLTSIQGIHPFVFSKSRNQIKNFSQAELKLIYKRLRDVDYEIKTGIIEAELALDLFVLEVCSNQIKEGVSEQMAADS